MDTIISAAIEEICTQPTTGISLSSLFHNLSPSLSSLSLPLCPNVKKAVWDNLVHVPGLKFEANGVFYEKNDPKIESLEECERMGLRIVAPDYLLDSFVGIYDIKASDSGVSQIQRRVLERLAVASYTKKNDPKIESLVECERMGLRIVALGYLLDSFLGIYDIKASDAGVSRIQHRVLERLAVAGTNGITQSELAKEFGIKGNNIFYVLRNLECRGLIVRHSTVLRTVDASNEKVSKTSTIVSTNMLHLHRYAKHLGSQQRLEVTKEDKAPIHDENSVDGAECSKEDVTVKDFLPALKAICDKLELADGKVLVVADIKRDLGYKNTPGHRAWRNILNRLKEARMVELFCAKVNNKEVSCLRLLKGFSPKNFEHRATQQGDDDDLGKRSRITDQLLELPIEHQIYDMIDEKGSEGLTITEICKRLGLNNKRYYTRLLSMFSRFGMHLEAENQNRGVAYRVWTPGNFHSEASTSFSNKPEKVSNPNTTSNLSEVWKVDVGDSDKLQQNATEPEPPCGSPTDNDICIESTKGVCNVAQLESSPDKTLSTPRKRRSYLQYPCLTLTAASARREHWILQMLQEKKFMIRSELRRELDSLEKDKQTMTDRKTLYRALNKLQQEGHCKCITVSAPVVTNCGRNKITEVILHASIDVTPELLGQIHERLRSFDIEIRHQSLTRLKKDEPVRTLDGVQRILKNAKLDTQAEYSEAMRANGYVLAKMVRTKLLHIYLWSYLSNSPGWDNTLLLSGKLGYDLKNPHSTCKLFSLDAAIKAMPLELFMQVVGSTYKFEDMLEKCRSGLCLSDIPDEEYRRIMDTRAMGRLSWIVDLLRRLKLIRLVRDGQSEENVTDVAHATLTYAMEIKPYIEEPVSVIVPSCGVVSFDLRPQIRHDFFLSSKDAVDAYWNTLEYSYAAADSRAALLAFPGSALHEVFHFRSWTSVRVMTQNQRAELHKRVENDDTNKKMSFKECDKVAKDLNLTLEQVLRVYYDKRRRLPRFEEVLEGEDLQSHNKQVSSPRKRKRPSRKRLSTATTEDDPSNIKNPDPSSDVDYNFTEEYNLPSNSLEEHGDLLKTSQYENHGEETEEPDFSKEREHHSLIHDCALSKMKSKRNKRFAWTEEAERKLVVEYARERAALGAKFHRIDWSSLHDLPAPPNACKRRMAVLNSDLKFRKAMMRLCNVLGEQYAKHLDKSQSNQSNCGDRNIVVRDSVFRRGCSSNNDELRPEKQWYNFEIENVKSALEDVLRFKTKKRSDSIRERSSLNINAEDTDPLETSTGMDKNACGNNIVHTGSTSSRRLSRKYTKLLNDGISVSRRTHDSLAVSTAVELFKLIFLSTSSTPDAPNLLARTLRRYSEHDLFAAFNYLREKKIMIGGTVGSPFVLSQQFLRSIYSSRFPVNTGKRAAKFSRWICEKEKDFIEDEKYIATDLQCGDMFQICALVFTGEFSVSPCLPDEGVGEPEDTRNSKRRVDCNENSICDKTKKMKPSSAREGDISNRREKGFPGIKLSVSRARLSKIDVVEMFKKDTPVNYDNEEADPNKYTIETQFSSNHLEEISNEKKNTPKGTVGTESEWEGMANYGTRLMRLLPDNNNKQVNHFDPELFKNLYSVIQKTGDQGLTMEEITQILNMPGEDVSELAVQVLEAFGRVVKVNAYASVHVVDSLYRSKYFLTSMATFSQHVEVALAKDSRTVEENDLPEQYDDVAEDVNNGVSDYVQPDNNEMHKITILNLPKEVSIPSTEVQRIKAVEGCDQVKGSSSGESVKAKNSEFQSGDFQLCRPILPWVNGDGTINKVVYKGLLRRVLGILMQNPGMVEDNIVNRMSVVNPQSCRELLKLMIMDKHIIVRKMNQRTSGEPPSILSSIFRNNFKRSRMVRREHFFANPMSTTSL